MKRPILTALAALLVLGAGAQAQEFRHRGWMGARLPNDKAQGCAMALDLRGQSAAFVIYANGERAFKIGLAARDWKLDQATDAIAAVTFDDSPPILLRGKPVSPTTLLFEPIDYAGEGGLLPLVEAARSAKMTYAGQYVRARLGGSSRAIELLQRCVAAPEPAEPRAADPASGGTVGAENSDERSAEFGFLRQGMTVEDANTRLLDAGWQTEAPPEDAPRGAGPELKALRDKGVFAQSCEGEPPSCVIDYVDAYGNALKVTAASGAEPRLTRWRLNPDDDKPRSVRSDGGQNP